MARGILILQIHNLCKSFSHVIIELRVAPFVGGLPRNAPEIVSKTMFSPLINAPGWRVYNPDSLACINRNVLFCAHLIRFGENSRKIMELSPFETENWNY